MNTKKRCFLVECRYRDGLNRYTETLLFRATRAQLERYLNLELERFAGGRSERFRLDRPVLDVPEHDQQRTLSVEAQEVRSLDGLPGWRVSEL